MPLVDELFFAASLSKRALMVISMVDSFVDLSINFFRLHIINVLVKKTLFQQSKQGCLSFSSRGKSCSKDIFS